MHIYFTQDEFTLKHNSTNSIYKESFELSIDTLLTDLAYLVFGAQQNIIKQEEMPQLSVTIHQLYDEGITHQVSLRSVAYLGES